VKVLRVYPALLIGAGFLFSALVYNRLPSEMPLHWTWDGEVDRYGSRFAGAFLMPAIALGLWILMTVLPKVDPRYANYQKFTGTYHLVVYGIITMMMVLHVLILGSVLGWPISIQRVVPAVVGVLLVITGNVLPRARSNWWFGVRTPWTLSNERVWAKTHRVAGYLMTLAGVAMLLSAAFPSKVMSGLAIGAAVLAAVGSIIYSYLIWRKEPR